MQLNIISNQAAASALGKPVSNHEVATTGVGSIRQGVCHGDSGGPLVVWSNALNQYVLIGVVSWGQPGCVGNNSTSPSIFVRVSSIVDWINSYVFSFSGPNLLCHSDTGIYTLTSSLPGHKS